MELWGYMSCVRVIDKRYLAGMTHRRSYVSTQPTPGFPFAVIVPVWQVLMLDVRRTTKIAKVWEAPRGFLTSKQSIKCVIFVALDGCVVKSNHVTNCKRPRVLLTTAGRFDMACNKIVQAHWVMLPINHSATPFCQWAPMAQKVSYWCFLEQESWIILAV